jgi:hypothetical protein
VTDFSEARVARCPHCSTKFCVEEGPLCSCLEQEEEEAEYPNPCCRCGFCCIAETCPVGMRIYRVSKHSDCPGLRFDGDEAICNAIEICKSWNIPHETALEIMGVGKGCCISARAFKDGEEYDFAGLNPEIKREIVRNYRLAKKGGSDGNQA